MNDGSTLRLATGTARKDEILVEKNWKMFFMTRMDYSIEEQIATNLVQRTEAIPLPNNVDSLIAKFESKKSKELKFQYSLAEEQREAVMTLLSSKTAIVTGGAGTGKTSVLECVVFIINAIDQSADICFLAPSGKAARRIEEATKMPASTIQKKIGQTLKGGKLKLITNNYVVVDESSMMDEITLLRLLKCLPPEARLFFLGDVTQLPSVGKGAVLRDMIDSKVIPVCQLEKTFRQKEGSVLSKNIQLIKKGMPSFFQMGNDFEWYEKMDAVLPIYFQKVQEYGRQNIVVLTPTRKVGKYCSEKLNNLIQSRVNNSTVGISTVVKRDGRKLPITFKMGDPVMQLVNREVANGDVGIVKDVRDGNLIVEYFDTTLSYYPSELWQLDLAYAISIHKSQGSEYPCVLSILDGGLLDKNLIYTAVTRAKKCHIAFGNQKHIMASAKKQSAWIRETLLAQLIEEKFVENVILQAI